MKKFSLLICAFSLVFIGLTSLSAAVTPERGKPVKVWTGYENSDWYNSKNWSPQGIPTCTDSVIILPDMPNAPAVEALIGTVLCRSLFLEEDLDKSSKGGMVISGGEIIIDGSLTIKSGATLTIGTDGALTVNGDVKIAATGGLVCESGGSLITNGSITGYAYVKRVVPNDLKWHFLSSPVTSYTILDGTFAPTAANFPTTPATAYDFYKFNVECMPEWWINLRNTDGTINTDGFGDPPVFEAKTGYLVAYGSGFNTTKRFTGTPNTGDQDFNLSTGAGDCSWNLLGNPYPSALNWNNVTGKGNLLTGYYYVWNENKDGGPGYEAYLDDTYKTPGTNGNIPSMQGFFVKANPAGNKVIGLPNASRVHDGDLWLKNHQSSNQNRLVVKISNGNHADESFILFGSDRNIGKDWYDAEKMMSLDKTIPQVYTWVDNDQKTVVNALPLICNPVSVPIGIIAPEDGSYSIEISGFESFSSLSGLTLEDLETGTSQNMVQNPKYDFEAAGNENSNRFLLHFTSPIGIKDQNDQSPIRIYSSSGTVMVTGTSALHDVSISIYNLVGQEVLFQKLNNQPINRIQPDVSDGYYIVKVQAGEMVKTVKVNILK